jgi:hypothetical protein
MKLENIKVDFKMGRKKEEGFLNGKMEINLKEFIKII